MNQSSPFKWLRFFTYFLLGAVLGFIVGSDTSLKLSSRPPFFSIKLSSNPPFPFTFTLPDTTLILLTIAGACGGVLYAMRNKELEFPHRTGSIYNPGWLGDCFFGVAGAYVISLIVPGDFPSTEKLDVQLTTQILATGIIGGYGGRSIIDRALDNILRQQEKLEGDQKQLKGQVDSNTSRLDEAPRQIEQQVEAKTQSVTAEVNERVKEQAKIDAQATTLFANYFDKSLPPDEQVEDLKQLIKAASPKQKADILLEAKKVREAARANRKSFIVRRTIPVFKALAESNTNDDGELHPIYAQLGYAFMTTNPQNWGQAAANLNEAIKTRNKSLEKSLDKTKKASFWVYEFNRAICRIQLNENHDLILQDLRDAAKLQNSTRDLIEYQDILDQDTKDLILNWVKNKSPEDLELINWLLKIFGSNYSAKDSELHEWLVKLPGSNYSNESLVAEAAP